VFNISSGVNQGNGSGFDLKVMVPLPRGKLAKSGEMRAFSSAFFVIFRHLSLLLDSFRQVKFALILPLRGLVGRKKG
jgi:hypothetical protein